MPYSLCGRREFLMRSDADFERELDNLSFAAQRDLLMLRLAHMYSLTSEGRRERCLESLSKLRDLLTEIETFLIDGQEEGQQQGRNQTTHDAFALLVANGRDLSDLPA